MATVEIDGKLIEADNGKMIIEVADEAGIGPIPRFCYHKELSVAANCRMCLVEILNSKKPVPACATPITNGMKVFTKSDMVLQSQKAVMEFLLINHPLDCPICDQGGECELQDVSMGYGQDNSFYHESKRAVDDDNLGSLVATEMTRCIHCTRCVRFGKEIAGIRELGATGRGEHMQIGTYVEHSLRSEVSANIIDLCPVGALTSKPYRYSARPWELTAIPSIAIHDCLGSHIDYHIRSNDIMRVVPRENQAINGIWISDRDRFSYLGLQHEKRAKSPKIKVNGQWKEVSWEDALAYATDGIARIVKHHGGEQVAGFASSSSSVESLFLFQKMLRGIGVNTIDYRTRQSDFSDESKIPTLIHNTANVADIDQMKHILLLGTHVTREVPIIAVKARKAFKNGATIHALNPVHYDYNMDIQEHITISPHEFIAELAFILKASIEKTDYQNKDDLAGLMLGLTPLKQHHAMAESLIKNGALIITGALIENHPNAHQLIAMVSKLCDITGAKHIHLSMGANTNGARLVGVLPDRGISGEMLNHKGMNVEEALKAKLKGYIMMGLDPLLDFNHPARARQAFLAAEFIVLLTTHDESAMNDFADVILPISSYVEEVGTYINADLCWQTAKAVVKPYESSRPAWKVLRVMGNLYHLDGFEYMSSQDVLNEVKQQTAIVQQPIEKLTLPTVLPNKQSSITRIGEWPIYGIDMLTRYSLPLQKAASADKMLAKIHSLTAKKYGLFDKVTVIQGDIEITLPIKHDDAIAEDTLWLLNGFVETMDLGHSFGEIIIKHQ